MEDEFSQHMPKSLQMMLKIERLAQERLRQIEKSIEDGETTLDAVKRERGLL